MQFETNVEAIYSYEEWKLTENEFKIINNYRNETMFALGNGYIGSRGTFEEGYDWDIEIGLEGNFINGFYESETVRYGELGIGFPEKSQTMLNVANAKIIKFYIEDEAFSMQQGTVSEYRRSLDLKKAILTRSLLWTSPKGKQVRLQMERLISLNCKNLMVETYRAEPINFSGTIKFVSEIDGDVSNHTKFTNPLIDYGPYEQVLTTIESRSGDENCCLLQQTKHTQFLVGCGCAHQLYKNGARYDMQSADLISEYTKSVNGTGVSYTMQAKEHEVICLEKYIAYSTSLDEAKEGIETVIQQTLVNAKKNGFEKEQAAQKEFMDHYWETADLQICGDLALQQGIRVNLFHILQGAGRDGKTGMGAKGLTGEGYEGHYFWDTEIYAMPFFTCTNSEITKKLLDFRYGTLDAARERAKEMSQRGALYPWRTINGQEASTYYPQGTAQYHINADIAYALNQYITITGDIEYLKEKGAEIFFETARLWADLGAFTPARGGKFCICDVTGPDEYSSIVDNNCYTNFMARENLLYAYHTAQWMKETVPKEYERLAKKIELDQSEIETWKRAADQMYFPYSKEMGIYSQDDTYLYKKPIDIATIPKDDFSLLLHSHPLVVYRYRLSKQVDLMMAMFLLSHRFTLEEKKKNFDFYETTTMHSSSLSLCISSILASEIGEYEKAYDYFSCTARLDLDDYHKNVYSGIHGANMAGTWMGMVFGFGGMRVHDDELSFKPHLPRQWSSYQFRVMYKKQVISVTADKKGITYCLKKGQRLMFLSHGEPVTLEEKQEISIPWK